MAVSLQELTRLIQEAAAAGQIPQAHAALQIQQATERFRSNPAEAAAAFAAAPDVYTSSPLAAQLRAREASTPTPLPASGQWVGGQWVEDRSPGMPVPHPSGLQAMAAQPASTVSALAGSGLENQAKVYPRSFQDESRISRQPPPTTAVPESPASRTQLGVAAPEFRIDQANNEVYTNVRGQWFKVPRGEVQFGWDQATNQWQVTYGGKAYSASAGSGPLGATDTSGATRTAPAFGDKRGAIGPGTRGPGAGSSTFGMRLDPRTGTAAGGPPRDPNTPPGWPDGVPYITTTERRIAGYDPATGQAQHEDVTVPDWASAFKYMQAYDLGGYAAVPKEARQKSVDDLISDAIAGGDFEKARSLSNFANSLGPQRQKSVNDLISDALASGNYPLAQALRDQVGSLTSTGREQQDYERRLVAEQQAREQAELQRQVQRQREQDALAESERQRLAGQRALDQSLDVQRLGLSREAQSFNQARGLEQEAMARRRQAFEQDLASRGFSADEVQRAWQRQLGERQFGLQQQAQGFGQGLQTLQAGLNVLRSPGDYWLYQTRLRDQQAPSTTYTGQEVASRGAFLQPFAQQLARGLSGFGGGQQGLAAQAGSPGLAQALAGQTVARPRQLPSIGAPPFLSLQDQARLLPSERQMRSAEVGALGIPAEDYEEQERRTFPRAFGPLSLRAMARRRVAA